MATAFQRAVGRRRPVARVRCGHRARWLPSLRERQTPRTSRRQRYDGAMRMCAFALSLFVCAGVAHAAEGQWEQIADKDGVKVYRRSIEGSRLKSMRGVGIVD